MTNRVIVAASAVVCAAMGGRADAQLTFEFTKSPGFIALEGSDPSKAASMYAAAVSAGAKFSGLFTNPVTLKYTLDYGATPTGVLAFADSTYAAVPYPTVKGALIGSATSSHDFTSLGGLPAGPFVPLFRNDTADLTFPEKEPFLDPTPGSTNNMMMDMSHSNLKALGLLGGATGAPGSDATIKISDDAAFDFDYTNGIDVDTFDFHGIMLHEIAHAMGFISGTDTVAVHLGSPPAVVDGVPMLTVLDLFRYSPLSLSFGARDLSLPIPGATGDAATRFFSIDGGATILEFFSTGTDPFGFGFGDGNQGGHWKDDGTFGLMDPELADEFNLSLAWEALLSGGMAPDLIALDVIGWTVPAPSSGGLVVVGLALGARRRRRV